MRILSSETVVHSLFDGTDVDHAALVDAPGENGLMAWTYPGRDATYSTTFFTTVTSTLYMSKFKMARTATPANLLIAVQTAASVTPTSSDVAIFNNSGTRLAVSASLNAVVNSTGIKTISIAPGVLTAGQYYHVGFRVTQASGTLPKLYGFAPTIDLGNAGLGAADAKFATVASQTTMPSSVTMASRVSSLNYFWAAIS